MWFSRLIPAATLKVAPTALFAVRTTVHDPVPLQLPVHPANVELVTGAAVRVTEVPLLNVTLHVVPQLMPAGLLVTVPAPVPARLTVSVGL